MAYLSVFLFCGLLTIGSTSPTVRDTTDVCLNRPNVPYVVSPQDGFRVGSTISLTGTVDSNSPNILFRFGNADMTKVVEMNINFFYQMAGFYDIKYYVTNIQTGKIRDLGPFARGQQFVVDISLMDGNIYSMTVNNEAFFDFTSEFPFEKIDSFGFGGNATLATVVLDGRDISNENGAEADLPDNMPVGARVTMDISVLQGFLFVVLFCDEDPHSLSCNYADSTNIATTVENATGSPFSLEEGTKYRIQFDLMEDAIEMSVNDTFIQTVDYKMPREIINLAWIWGNIAVDCISYEPSSSSMTKRESSARHIRSVTSPVLSPFMLHTLMRQI